MYNTTNQILHPHRATTQTVSIQLEGILRAVQVASARNRNGVSVQHKTPDWVGAEYYLQPAY